MGFTLLLVLALHSSQIRLKSIPGCISLALHIRIEATVGLLSVGGMFIQAMTQFVLE